MTNNYHDPIPNAAPGLPITFNRPLGQLDLGIGNMLSGGALYPFKRDLLTTSGAKTLSTDTLDVANLSFVTVSAETGTADNLSTLINPVAGATYILQAAAGHVITIKHGVGNIFLNGGVDITLSGNKQIELFYSPLGLATNLAPAFAQSTVRFVSRTVIGSPVASVTLSSIPATAQHLLLIMELRSAVGSTVDTPIITFNGDTAANYYSQYSIANAAVFQAAEFLATNNIFLSQAATGSTAPSGANGVTWMWITNYTSTTMRKVVQYTAYRHANNSSGGLAYYVGAGDWTNTANAISSINIAYSGGSNIAANSAYELFGLN